MIEGSELPDVAMNRADVASAGVSKRMRPTQDLMAVLKLRAVQLLALAGLFVGVGTECFITKLSVLDLDVWWHLSVGDWIVQHGAFPHTGILSRTAENRPWMAYSWGYEVLLSRSYAWLGFLGMAMFGTMLTIAVAIGLFWMLHQLSGRFWVAWTLSILVYSAFLFNIMPRPVFFTMLLYSITLTLILKAQRRGQVELLYWLPLVFLIWANIHIQFIYGLFALGLFAGINLLERLAISMRRYPNVLLAPTLPLAPLFAILACCGLASCVGPYTFHLYGVVFGYSNSKVFYTMISELQSLSFLGVSHFLELLLAAGAFFTLGWQKKLDLFKLALLAVASIFAFRTTRDAWFICITAAAIIADVPVSSEELERRFKVPELAGVALVTALFLVLIARNTDFNERGLDRTISSVFPVDAVNFLRRDPVGGPLFNSFDWGGFLIFYMPQYPVSIDGRGDLYGDDRYAKNHATEGAEPSYSADPYLNEAGLVLLKKTVPLARLLPTDRRFRVIYSDDIALVLARN
jgi:hypothetical protein